jgi:hypothetical protein
MCLHQVLHEARYICEGFGEHSLNLTLVFECNSHFKADQVSVEDDEHSGQPSTSKTTKNFGTCP